MSHGLVFVLMAMCARFTFAQASDSQRPAAAVASPVPSPPEATSLPRPDFRFQGQVGRTYEDSDPPTFPQIVRPGKGAPNVLLILLDDSGFGQFSAFGGGVPSPNIESEALSPGRAVIRVDFAYDGGGIGKGGTVRLFVNDKKVAEGRIEKSCPSRFGAESFDVGMDSASPVSESYRSPFAYAGTIKRVDIHIAPSALRASDQQKVRAAELKAAMAIE